MENKNITIDDLARMVQSGFEGVDKNDLMGYKKVIKEKIRNSLG